MEREKAEARRASGGRRRPALLAVCLSALASSLLSCSESPTEPRGREPLAFETVFVSPVSGIGARRGELITDAGRWGAVWNEIQRDTLPQPPVPSVDFEREMLLLAAMGEKPAACWRIEIESVKATGERSIEVRVLEERSPPSCICATVLVDPVQVVKVHRLDRLDRRPSFRFEQRVSSGICE